VSEKSGSDKSGSDKSGSNGSVSEPSTPGDPGDYPDGSKEKYTTTEGQPVWGNVLDNDPNGSDAVAVELKSWPQHGYIMLNNDGSFDYVPYDGFVGEDVFQYVVRDANGNSTIGEVCITILPSDDPGHPTDPTDPIDPDPTDPDDDKSGKSGSNKSGSDKSGNSGSNKSGSDKSGSGKDYWNQW